jgi:uncharacterized protein YerC
VAKSAFCSRFGIESKRAKVTQEVVVRVKQLLAEGKTLAQAAEETGVSTATCQKIKKGDYDQ